MVGDVSLDPSHTQLLTIMEGYYYYNLIKNNKLLKVHT